MQVVILCGGLGTRLREETEYRPKPMVYVGNRPFLWHIMKSYAARGHNEFTLCLGYQGEVIHEFSLNYLSMTSDLTLHFGQNASVKHHSNRDEKDRTITLVETGMKTMTGGRLARVMPSIRAEDFLLTYGDGLCDSDINAIIDFHESHGGLAALTAFLPENRFDHLGIEGTRVRRFQEGRVRKRRLSRPQQTLSRVYRRRRLRAGKRTSHRLAEEGQLHAFQHRGFWQCMNNYREFEILNRMRKTYNAHGLSGNE